MKELLIHEILIDFFVLFQMNLLSFRMEERKYWYDNRHSICVQEFRKNGELEGCRKYWYESGILMAKEFFRNGKREGKRNMWYRNGQINEQTFYEKGLIQGEDKKWCRNGNPAHEWWKDGLPVDLLFTSKKKLKLLRVKKHLRRLTIPELDHVLIRDLKFII